MGDTTVAIIAFAASITTGVLFGWGPWMHYTLKRIGDTSRPPLPGWWELTWLVPFAVVYLATSALVGLVLR